MVVIEDTIGFKTIPPLLGPEYRPKGVNVPLHPDWDICTFCVIFGPPSMRVIVVLPLISSITTVNECPRGALLDSRPAFLQTRHFRLFIL